MSIKAQYQKQTWIVKSLYVIFKFKRISKVFLFINYKELNKAFKKVDKKKIGAIKPNELGDVSKLLILNMF
jgi:hypothetical protein